MTIFTLLILPLLSLIFLFRPKNNSSWQESILKAMIAFSFLIVILTEGLSSLQLIEKSALFWCWLVISLSLFILNLKYFLKLSTVKPPQLFDHLKRKRQPELAILLAAVAVVSTLTFFLALYIPPNTWDSMTYHLPRVEQWVQHKSLDLYPVENERQLYIPPFTEYVYLHIRLLSQTTDFLNIIQWLAMIGSLITVALVTKKLGGNQRQQVIAAFLTAMLPMGAMQAYSTQTDYVAGFFSVSCLFWLIKFDQNSDTESGIFLALSIGLALLSKPTSAFLFVPLLIVFFVRKLLSKDFLHLFQLGCFILIGVLLINAGHWTRVYTLYGSPLGKPKGDVYLVGGYSPNVLLSNGLKSLSLELASPFKTVNRAIENSVLLIHQVVLKIDTNSPLTSWQTKQYGLRTILTSSSIGAPLHLILICFTVFSLFFTRKTKNSLRLITYLAILFGFFLELTLLLWQPWITRLHLLFLIVCSPYIALALDKINLGIQRVMFIVLFLFCLYCIGWNIDVPLVGVNSIFHTQNKDLTYLNGRVFQKSFKQAARFISDKKYETVGFCGNGDEWEFPLWKELHNLHSYPLIHSVCSDNISSQLTSATEIDKVDDVMVCVKCYEKDVTPAHKYHFSKMLGDHAEITVFFNK